MYGTDDEQQRAGVRGAALFLLLFLFAHHSHQHSTHDTQHPVHPLRLAGSSNFYFITMATPTRGDFTSITTITPLYR